MKTVHKHKYMFLTLSFISLIHILLFFTVFKVYNFRIIDYKQLTSILSIISHFSILLFFILLCLNVDRSKEIYKKVKLDKLILTVGLFIITAYGYRYLFEEALSTNLFSVIYNVICYIIIILEIMLINYKDKIFNFKINKKEFLKYSLILIIMAFFIRIYNFYFAYNLVINNISNFKIIYYPWCMLWIINTFLTATVEELIFRGLIQTYLIEKFDLFKAIFIQGIIFGLPHILNLDFSQVNLSYIIIIFYDGFFLGSLFGIVYHRTKSLLYPIILHAFVNLFTGYFLYIIF